MIYIFDNGEDYSDHTIEFVSTAGFDDEDAEKILRHFYRFGDKNDYPKGKYDRGFLIAKVLEVDWYVGKPKLLTWVFHWRAVTPCPEKFLDDLHLTTVTKLYDHWKKAISDRKKETIDYYKRHPQPKRAARLKEEGLQAIEESEKELTEAMDNYLNKRRS